MSLDESYNMVRDFHVAFGHPNKDKPTALDKERSKVRASWMDEEVREFTESECVVEQADAMIDLIYFALGTLVEMGVKPDKLFKIVQDANMSKIWPDGKVHYKPDGKVQKPSTWEDPHPKLESEIKRQEKIIEA